MDWEDAITDPRLIDALRKNNMPYPTEIQKESLAISYKYHQDIRISSKKDSGKTLCFAIPLLLSTEKSAGLQSLIISPNRELCIQMNSQITGINYKFQF